MAILLEATVKFRYSAKPENYPLSSPEGMAKLDKLEFSGNTEILLETLANTEYSVDVAPVVAAKA